MKFTSELTDQQEKLLTQWKKKLKLQQEKIIKSKLEQQRNSIRLCQTFHFSEITRQNQSDNAIIEQKKLLLNNYNSFLSSLQVSGSPHYIILQSDIFWCIDTVEDGFRMRRKLKQFKQGNKHKTVTKEHTTASNMM